MNKLINMRWLIKKLIVYVFFIFPFVLATGQKTIKSRPNIIIIFMDDMGYGDPACYNGLREKPDNVIIKEYKLPVNNVSDYTFPAHSITVITLKGKI